jgi:hypothetical protein
VSVIPAQTGTQDQVHRSGGTMSATRYLAVLPFLGILVGVIFLNRATPLVLGLPLLFAWLLLWIVLTSAIMAIIYLTDPANRVPKS